MTLTPAQQEIAALITSEALSRGYSPAAASAMVTHAVWESRLDPTLSHPDGIDPKTGQTIQSNGLFQMNRDRWDASVNYATKNGLDPWSAQAQIGFTFAELDGSVRAKNSSDYSKIGDRLMSAQTPEEASRAMSRYEGHAPQYTAGRVEDTQAFFDQYAPQLTSPDPFNAVFASDVPAAAGGVRSAFDLGAPAAFNYGAGVPQRGDVVAPAATLAAAQPAAPDLSQGFQGLAGYGTVPGGPPVDRTVAGYANERARQQVEAMPAAGREFVAGIGAELGRMADMGYVTPDQMTVTSGARTHQTNSTTHPSGLAVDLRTAGLTPEQQRSQGLAAMSAGALGLGLFGGDDRFGASAMAPHMHADRVGQDFSIIGSGARANLADIMATNQAGVPMADIGQTVRQSIDAGVRLGPSAVSPDLVRGGPQTFADINRAGIPTSRADALAGIPNTTRGAMGPNPATGTMPGAPMGPMAAPQAPVAPTVQAAPAPQPAPTPAARSAPASQAAPSRSGPSGVVQAMDFVGGLPNAARDAVAAASTGVGRVVNAVPTSINVAGFQTPTANLMSMIAGERGLLGPYNPANPMATPMQAVLASQSAGLINPALGRLSTAVANSPLNTPAAQAWGAYALGQGPRPSTPVPGAPVAPAPPAQIEALPGPPASKPPTTPAYDQMEMARANGWGLMGSPQVPGPPASSPRAAQERANYAAMEANRGAGFGSIAAPASPTAISIAPIEVPIDQAPPAFGAPMGTPNISMVSTRSTTAAPAARSAPDAPIMEGIGPAGPVNVMGPPTVDGRPSQTASNSFWENATPAAPAAPAPAAGPMPGAPIGAEWTPAQVDFLSGVPALGPAPAPIEAPPQVAAPAPTQSMPAGPVAGPAPAQVSGPSNRETYGPPTGAYDDFNALPNAPPAPMLAGLGALGGLGAPPSAPAAPTATGTLGGHGALGIGGALDFGPMSVGAPAGIPTAPAAPTNTNFLGTMPTELPGPTPWEESPIASAVFGGSVTLPTVQPIRPEEISRTLPGSIIGPGFGVAPGAIPGAPVGPFTAPSAPSPTQRAGRAAAAATAQQAAREVAQQAAVQRAQEIAAAMAAGTMTPTGFNVPGAPLGYEATSLGYGPLGPMTPAGYEYASDPAASAATKIVCTAMNRAYGFGSFRNAIWLRYSATHMTPAHERGYHRIFGPVLRFAEPRTTPLRRAVWSVLTHLMRHRTADLRAVMHGRKRDTLGRLYRAVFEPLCALVGRHS